MMKAKEYLKARVEYDKVFECGDWMYGVYRDKFHFTEGVSLHYRNIEEVGSLTHFAADLFSTLERLDICVTHIGLPEYLILHSKNGLLDPWTGLRLGDPLWGASLAYTPSGEWFVQGEDILTLSGRIEDGYAFLTEREGEHHLHVDPFMCKLTFIDTHEPSSLRVSA